MDTSVSPALWWEGKTKYYSQEEIRFLSSLPYTVFQRPCQHKQLFDHNFPFPLVKATEGRNAASEWLMIDPKSGGGNSVIPDTREVGWGETCQFFFKRHSPKVLALFFPAWRLSVCWAWFEKSVLLILILYPWERWSPGVWSEHWSLCVATALHNV